MRPNESGFTLKELLLVMAVILLLGTLVLPISQHTFKRYNEATAISSLHMVNQMQGQYLAAYPTHGFACSLKTLGGNKNIPASANAANLLNPDLASGLKSGYRFTLYDCDGAHYKVNAVPTTLGKTGDRGFCTDDTDKLTFDPNGGTNCTDPIQ